MRYFAVVLLGACASAGNSPPGGQDHPDAPHGTPADAPDHGDGPDIDAPPMMHPDTGGGGGSAAALVLTEVVLAPTTGEFIEIANPTSQTVDLSTYYVSDSGSYFKLPAGPVTVDSSDFIAQFPAGATIAPGAVITVAIDTAANFQTVYGAPPTYSLASGTITKVASTGTPTLTNAGEVVVLFQWGGQSDLVGDVDIMIVGAPTAANSILDKSGQAFDGPDTGATTTAYATDGMTMQAQASAPPSGMSTKRIALASGHEGQGGNGVDGDDQTSEDTAQTWDTTFTAPTPGSVPTGLLQ